MNPIQAPFLIKCRDAAKAAGHPWPAAAAAEAWCETGGVHFPPNSNNVLGIKAGRNYAGKTVTANGTEQLANGALTPATAMSWRVYASLQECFADQVRILHTQKNSDGSLHYGAALAALTIEAYIVYECAAWSTDAQKGLNVLATLRAHRDILLGFVK